MKTPAGSECRYFFGDYYRGRNHEECRLIGNAPPPHHWTRDLCQKCPVPEILLANACTNMVLDGKVKRGPLGLGKKVVITAYCNFVHQIVTEPHIGCGHCHPLPAEFLEKKS